MPTTAGTGAAVHSAQSSSFKSPRSFWHVWVCWSQPDDTVFIQDGEMCETMRSLAAERCCRSASPPCHPALQTHVLFWQWPLSGSPQSAGQTGTSQASPFQASSHSQNTEPVEFLTRHSPRPEQLLGHVFTLRGRKRGKETEREKPGFRIQTLNKTSGTPYIN